MAMVMPEKTGISISNIYKQLRIQEIQTGPFFQHEFRRSGRVFDGLDELRLEI